MYDELDEMTAGVRPQNERALALAYLAYVNDVTAVVYNI